MKLTATMSELEAFRAGDDGAWDRAAACHLIRRVAFGCPQRLVAKALERGPDATVAELLGGAMTNEDIALIDDVTMRSGSLSGAQGWWIYRMLHGAAALEKLALFWHGHFATSNQKVEKPRLMMRQIELFQRLGAGKFAPLLLEVARDPAMVIWLDGNSNRRGRPNENWARELMELFSLGIGNYTEADIKEAARAFTGWHEHEGEFYFSKRAHDSGAKTVFGKTGDWGGEEIIRLCVEQPACAEFIARKLFAFYVHPDPSNELVDLLAGMLRDVDLEVGAFLRRLWSSRLFFRADVRRALVSTPIDLVAGSVATLGARADTRELAKLAALMGQDLLRPPSVKGWDGGMAWLDSTTLLARYRFAVSVAGGDSIDVPWEEIPSEPGRVVDLFFPEGLAGDVAREILSAASGDAKLAVAGLLQLPENQFI